MLLNLNRIFCNLVLEGDISESIKDKYKGNFEFKKSTNKNLSLYSENNNLKINSEDHLEKTVSFLENTTSAPKDIQSILKNLKDNKKSISKIDLIKTGTTNFIIHFLENSSEIPESSENYKKTPTFYSTDKNLAKELNVPFPGFLAYNSEDKTFYELPQKYKEENLELKDIIKIISVPVIGVIDGDNVLKYDQLKLRVLYILSDKDRFESLYEEFKEIREKYKNTIKIGLVEYSENSNAHKQMAKKEDLPTTIGEIENERVFLHNTTAYKLEKFIEDLKNGNIKPPIKEEEIVDNSNNNVKIAVRKNAEALIENKEKDVLVVFYAHWCSFCKILMPELEKLGEMAKDNAKVDIVKIDLSKNHLPQYKVDGYPTIKLYKAKTNEIIQYTKSSRKAEDFIEFIKIEGFFKEDLKNKSLTKENIQEEKKINQDL